MDCESVSHTRWMAMKMQINAERGEDGWRGMADKEGRGRREEERGNKYTSEVALGNATSGGKYVGMLPI